MHLGSAFAVFAAVAVVIMVLFCLLLKYFSYRRKRMIRQNEAVCSLNDELFKEAEEVHDGAYDEFCSRRKEEKASTSRKKLVVEDQLIEMGDLKQVLNVSNNIYGMSNLRKRLNSDSLPLTTLATETNRSLGQTKEFNLQRLSTQQSHKNDRKYHQFVKKLVRYSSRGLSIFQANVKCLNMADDQIVLDKTVEENVILQNQQTFQDLLQINGFEKCNFGYYKYTCSIDITNVKEGSSYPFKVMKSTQSKETITQDEYFKWLEMMHSSK